MIKGCPSPGHWLLKEKGSHEGSTVLSRQALVGAQCFPPPPQSISSKPDHPSLVRLCHCPSELNTELSKGRHAVWARQLTAALHKGESAGMPRHPPPAHTHIHFLPHSWDRHTSAAVTCLPSGAQPVHPDYLLHRRTVS